MVSFSSIACLSKFLCLSLYLVLSAGFLSFSFSTYEEIAISLVSLLNTGGSVFVLSWDLFGLVFPEIGDE